jgi:hypothetical protein
MIQSGASAQREPAVDILPGSSIETGLFRFLCGLLIGLCAVVSAVDGLFFQWNGIRLSRALALVGGYDLYTPADSGVIAGLIYGPVGYFFYTPAVVWGSPVPAIITGCLISVLITLGPAALLLSDHRIIGEARPWVMTVFTVLVLHFYASSATPGVWMVHTDASAIGLTCLALYFTLQHPAGRPFSWNLVAVGLSASLAVWAKQTTAPILIIPFAYLLLRRCRGGALWVLTLTLAFAGLFAAVFSALYGFDDLRLTVLEVPSRHPRFPGVLVSDWRVITDFMEMLYLLGVVIVGSSIIAKRSVQETKSAVGARILARCSAFVPDWTAWPLVCATGLALLPMSMLGRMKSGGTANNFGLTDYFLALGIALLFLRLAARSEFRQGTARRALQVSLLLLLVVMGVRTTASLLLTGREIVAQWPAPDWLAYDYIRKQPGTTYFPWQPLAHLLGEGRYFHTAWGVMERDLAGFLVSEEHFREHLPENLQRLAAQPGNSLFNAVQSRQWDHYPLPRLPEFRCRLVEPLLPGWMVLEKGPQDCRLLAEPSATGPAPAQ